MRLAHAAVILTGLALIALAGGCTHETRDWQSAQSANTIEAYEQFITQHPKSARVADAQVRVGELTEARDWQRASTTDTADAYRQFLAQHPQGKTVQEARIRIENFGLNGTAAASAPTSAAPPAAAAPASPAVARAREPSAPRPGPAEPPGVSAEESGGGSYGIQLGAFSTHAKAQNEWRDLNAHYGAELRGAIANIERGKSGHGRQVYRLKAKGLTEARARGICAALKKRSQACVVVLPGKH